MKCLQTCEMCGNVLQLAQPLSETSAWPRQDITPHATATLSTALAAMHALVSCAINRSDGGGKGLRKRRPEFVQFGDLHGPVSLAGNPSFVGLERSRFLFQQLLDDRLWTARGTSSGSEPTPRVSRDNLGGTCAATLLHVRAGKWLTRMLCTSSASLS